MNAERLHALAIALKSDLDQTDLTQRLGGVMEALQRVMDSPDSGNQEAVGHALGALHAALDESAVGRFSPSWTGLLEEMGFHDILGTRLRGQVDELFQRTQITPWIAKEEIQKWVDELNGLRQALVNLTDGMAELKIDSQELEGEDCEIGFIIPRNAVENRLDRFAAELGEFHSIFRTFSEVAEGEPQEFEIGALSSSGLTVYVNTQPAVAAVTATALSRIIAVYRQLLEIRKLRTELGAQDVPPEALKMLDEHTNSKIADAIDDIAVALVLEYYPSEDGRRAKELSNEVRNCLRKLANRIDRGYHFDVRAAEPRETAPGENERRSVEETQESFHLETIRRAAPALQFIHLEGEPVLNLAATGIIKKAFLSGKGSAKPAGATPPAKSAPVKKRRTKRKAKRKTASRRKTPAGNAKPSEPAAGKGVSRIASTVEATAKKVTPAPPEEKAPAKKKATAKKKARPRKKAK